MNSKKWIKLLSIGFILGFVFVGFTNYIVDPYGLNSNKNKYDVNLSKVSTAELIGLKVNLLSDYYLVGTSRVIRIDPNLIESFLNNKRVYNVNISGATYKENAMLAKKIISNNSNFIFGFDAFSLNETRLKEQALIHRYASYKKALEEPIISSYKYFFSLNYTLATCKHIIDKIFNKNTHSYYNKKNKKNYTISLEEIKKNKDISNKGNQKAYSNFEIVKKKDIISLAQKATHNDIFIIYPKHFYHYLLFQKHQDIEKKYFNAIRTLVKNTNAKVWSFYGINEITKDPKNFDEYGWHFKQKISKTIFARVFNDNSVDIPEGFGKLLTKENVDNHLTELSNQIKSYNLK